MKTNGSMICRQRHINNAIRERRTPSASSSHSPAFSSTSPHLSHRFLLPTSFPSLFAGWDDYFAWEPCYSFCSSVFGKESYKVLIWKKRPLGHIKICCQRQWKRSYRCVPTGSADPGLCCQPLLCRSIHCHPPVCPFLFVLFHSFSSYLSCEKDPRAEQGSLWNRGLS